MEFTADMVSLQGLLTSVSKTTGAFKNLKFKGGNEDKLSLIIKEIRDYLNSKNYIKNQKINNKYDKKISDLVFYLIVNTDFDNSYFKNSEDFTHLVNTIPSLSKCIMINILVELDLSEKCSILKKFPSKLTVELINELIPCMKHAKPEQSLYPSVNFLKAAVYHLSALQSNRQNEEIIEKLSDASVELVRNLGGINPEHVQNWKSQRVYGHMGYTFINLLKLLQDCDFKNPNLSKLIDAIISACISVFKAITVNVFCVWAEIVYEGQPLQTAIASEAYKVVECFQSYKLARDLIQMLDSIAKKPKTLSELILEADVDTIIHSIESNNSEPNTQKHWFTALLNTQVFSNKKSIECLKEYSHLCSEEDVHRILNMSLNYSNIEVKKVAIKCTQHLSSSTLNTLMTRFFFLNGTKPHLRITDRIEEKLVLLLNNLQKGQEKEGTRMKELQLLLLEDPEETLKVMIKECLKKSVYIECLFEIFKEIQPIAKIDSLWFQIFGDVIIEFQPSNENLQCYVEFINMLISLEYTSFAKLSDDILVPLINNFVTKEQFSDILVILQLIHNVRNINGDITKLLEVLLTLLNTTRCKFLEFSQVKQECAKEIVDILSKRMQLDHVTADKVYMGNLGKINMYYFDSLVSGSHIDFLQYMLPNVASLQYSELVGKCIQLLPQCVETEWSMIFSSLTSKLENIEKTSELLTDFLILLCQLVDSQSDKQSEQSKTCTGALKYCIAQYGIIFKKFLLNADDIELKKIGAINVCRLLKHIPDEIKEEEGLKLAGVLPRSALQELTTNDTFVYSVAGIGNATVAQVIAKNMLP